MKAHIQSQSQAKVQGLEAQLAYQLTLASFEHEYYRSCMDECFDPQVQEDLLSKMGDLLESYQSAREAFEQINPEALMDFERGLSDQKQAYFSKQLLN